MPTLNGPLTLGAGWVSVDAKVRGKTFRFITSHMGLFSTALAAAQAQELLAGPAAPGMRVVVTADLNSVPTEPAHAVMTGAGFTDAWAATNPGEPGFTAFQVPPDSIVNPISNLHSRIDYLFARGLEPSEVDLVGATPSSRTPSGLWPSDHAGLVGTFEIERRSGDDR